ncbi:glycosyltransferase family 2 protein [Candidatus Pacearchaeota archaeon]|nr:glycosyltransferase family 2 protein [Candidatus Pacearchaeota archaeon]
MIDIIITSYNEPKSTLRAVNAFLKQEIPDDYRITVVDPFPHVGTFLKKNIKSKKFTFFLDPGEGKSYALNLLLQEYASKNTNDLFILTDGDVYVSDTAVKEIVNAFKDKKVGAVTGRPVSLDNRDTKYGFWAHVAFSGIDRVRKRLSEQKKFFECSGYLFAIRKGVIIDFPVETSEDSIIPYLFWKKKYRIEYAKNAEVYVKNPSTWKDWLTQKVRNIKAHENLNAIAPGMPRTKSLFNEIKEGAFFTLKQPKNFKQAWWMLELYFARLYIYYKAFSELRKKRYADGWRDIATPSTKTLD